MANLRIAHFAPFAPHMAGIYEAARDMVLADRLAGRTAEFVDTGATVGGVRQPGQIGAEDARPSSTLVTVDPLAVEGFDLFVLHDDIGNTFLRRNSVPIVGVIHGRPLASRDSGGWDFVADLAARSRVKRLITLWPRHVPFWAAVVAPEKLRALPAPLIDQEQFSATGPAHEFPTGLKGEFNVLVADSWREIDPWELLHGLLLAAPRIPGLRVHTYAVEGVGEPKRVPRCWDYVFQAMDRAGIRGEVCDRLTPASRAMDTVYRACDLVASPHVIATRIIGEALSCGTAVLAAQGNEFAQYTCQPGDPPAVVDALVSAWQSWKRYGRGLDGLVAEAARAFAPATFAERIGLIYREALT